MNCSCRLRYKHMLCYIILNTCVEWNTLQRTPLNNGRFYLRMGIFHYISTEKPSVRYLKAYIIIYCFQFPLANVRYRLY